jgi:hypothetical protein
MPEINERWRWINWQPKPQNKESMGQEQSDESQRERISQHLAFYLRYKCGCYP